MENIALFKTKETFPKSKMVGYDWAALEATLHKITRGKAVPSYLSKKLGFGACYLSQCKASGEINRARAKVIADFLKIDIHDFTFEKEKEESDPFVSFEEPEVEEHSVTEKLLAEISHEIHVNNELIRQLIKLWEQ